MGEVFLFFINTGYRCSDSNAKVGAQRAIMDIKTPILGIPSLVTFSVPAGDFELRIPKLPSNFWIDPKLADIVSLIPTGSVGPRSLTLEKALLLSNPQLIRDRNIIDELDSGKVGSHKIPPLNFARVLFSELTKMERGETSELFVEGRTSLLYVDSFVVSIQWSEVISVWRVFVNYEGSSFRPPGSAIFVPAKT